MENIKPTIDFLKANDHMLPCIKPGIKEINQLQSELRTLKEKNRHLKNTMESFKEHNKTLNDICKHRGDLLKQYGEDNQ